MIDSHLAQLRRVVDETKDLPEATRTELLRLVNALESESVSEPKVPADIAVEKKEDQTVLDQLRRSIEELEATHPEAAAAVHRVATVLANMGI